MNANQLLGAGAIALASATAFAQTVPAEQWVGAPVPTGGSSYSRSAVAAELAASGTMARAPQELRVGPADPSTGAMSRIEVTADARLWVRSGMSQIANRDGFDPYSPGYRAQLAAYQRMRNGPEFMAEVQRLQGGTRMNTAAYAAPTAAE